MSAKLRVRGPRVRLALLLGAALLAASAGRPASVMAESKDELMKQVRLDQRLNAQVPLDLQFRDEAGKPIRLGQVFGKKPVMLIMIQYRCTMLCSREMEALLQSLQEMKFSVGKEFNLVTMSIDSRETELLAGEYKRGYLKKYARPSAADGWHFLTGDERSVRALADAVGFHFAYDAQTDQFLHPDGVIILTPKGRIARYFFRLEYPPRDMRLALVEAADGKIGSPMDGFWLSCYYYNPMTGRYSLALMGIVRMMAVATVLLLATGVGVMGWRSRARKPRAPRAVGSEG
jgi:protein SCO1/2